MANNCQMMCVIKAESMLWSLWSHSSSTDRISYANESEQVSKPIPGSNTGIWIHAFKTCSGCTQSQMPSTSIANLRKKENFWQENVTHTAWAYEHPQVMGVGGLFREPSNSVIHKVQSIPFHSEDRDPGDQREKWPDRRVLLFSAISSEWVEISSEVEGLIFDNVSINNRGRPVKAYALIPSWGMQSGS